MPYLKSPALHAPRGVGVEKFKEVAISRMCLIAVSDTGFKELKPSFWRSCCTAFAHGLGLMYFHEGVLHTEQHLEYDSDALQTRLRTVPSGIRIALHLRAATFGSLCQSNLHPHVLHLEGPAQAHLTLALMHNGSIPSLQAHPNQGPSDSSVLAQCWLKDRISSAPLQWDSPPVLSDLHELAGNQNRLVLLDHRGKWVVIGETLGFTHEGTWLSNKKVAQWL